MEAKRKIYPSSQLVVALDAKCLKVAMWILGWSSQGSVKYYPRQFAKACKMEEKEVELCIQTLVNCKLIDVSLVDQTWMLTPNGEQFQKYYEVPIANVLEGNGIPMAKEVTWNVEKTPQNGFKCEIEDLSEKDIKAMILRLQASLEEKEQMRKKVVSVEPTDLPF